MILFLKLESRKIIATIIVAIVFLYFWMNGPLLQNIEILSLESIKNVYSKPVMVGEKGVNKGSKSNFKTLNLSEENKFGYGLLLNKKIIAKNWGLIADANNNPGLSKTIQKEILEHAIYFSDKNKKVALKPAMGLYYATISNNKTTSIYLESTAIIKNIRGYAGEINVGVFIDENGFIQSVKHIASKETQSYLADIKNAGFYEQFKLVNITKGPQEIDAVSGATLTSEAITKTVSELIKIGTPYPISNYAEIDEINSFSVKAFLNSTWILHIIVIFLMFFFAIQRWKKKSKKSILMLYILSVIYLGFFLNNSFTYVSFLHPFLGTSVSSLVGLYSLFVLLGAIWGKNTYCKYICPFGNIQKLIIQANPVKSQRKFFLSNKTIKRIRAAITLILITGILLGLRNWSNFELFPDLFGLSILSVWFVIAVITVLSTVVYPMIWCRLLCPTGAVLDGLSDLMKPRKKS